MTLKDHLRGKVRFVRYQNGELWYVTPTGFEFPIPITDTGTGVFKAEDNGILFMRWVRIHMEMLEAARDRPARITWVD
jgi:hypothetical protein